MGKELLLALDSVFAFFGIFWAGLVFFRALSLNFNVFEWLLLFGIMLAFLYPLIRKTVEFLFEDGWKGFLQIFEGDWKKQRIKKRWNY